VIKALVELGANVNTLGNDKATPVYIAAQKGHVSAIRALYELGGDVNTPKEDNGSTPV
jgi:ankyrin repeat protein